MKTKGQPNKEKYIKMVEEQFSKDLSIPDINKKYIIEYNEHDDGCGDICDENISISGLTLLMKCVFLGRNYPHLFNGLELHKIDINVKASENETALSLASKYSATHSTEKIVKKLINAKANVNLSYNLLDSVIESKTSTENTALMLMEADINLIKTRDIDICFSTEYIFINAILEKCYYNLIEKIINYYDKLNLHNHNEIILHGLINNCLRKDFRKENEDEQYCVYDLVKQLIELKIDINISDDDGDTLLEKIILYYKKENNDNYYMDNLLILLINNGAKMYMTETSHKILNKDYNPIYNLYLYKQIYKKDQQLMIMYLEDTFRDFIISNTKDISKLISSYAIDNIEDEYDFITYE